MSMLELSTDNINTIFSFLQLGDLVNTRRVCKSFFHMSMNPLFWRSIDISQICPNFSNAVKFLNSIFTTHSLPTEEIFISSSVTRYILDNLETLTRLCPLVKKFRLEFKQPQGDEDNAFPYRNMYDFRPTVPFEILDKIRPWSLDTIEFVGEGVFNTVQDYFGSFFQFQPNLRYFRCDFKIASSATWGFAPPPDPTMSHYATHGIDSLVYFASLHCKGLKTLVAPKAELRRYMIGRFATLEDSPIEELVMNIQPFSNTTEARNFAMHFKSLRVLHLNFCWGDWTGSFNFLAPFITALPCIETIIVNKDSCYDFSNIIIRSSTLKEFRIESGSDQSRMSHFSNLTLCGPKLELITLNHVDLHGLHLGEVDSLKTIVLKSSTIDDASQEILGINYPQVNISLFMH